ADIDTIKGLHSIASARRTLDEMRQSQYWYHIRYVMTYDSAVTDQRLALRKMYESGKISIWQRTARQ
ncbi:MAG TPA: hypothetical protein VFH43_04200, partial [Candidatus Kapabacteria bacterium]|nr:hypothetical protein [Candidatus Kapabacteria bacterium]